MAGTVVASYLNDGTTSGSTTDMVKGSARAWVNFNGTGTVAIRASYNVSSITDNGVGFYTINLTNPLVDINGCVVGVACDSATNDVGNFNQWISGVISSTTSVVVASVYYANGYQDNAYNQVAVFR